MQYFYMMCGIPGSGKTFYAERIPNATVHSSDKIREELLGDSSDQSRQTDVFAILHSRIKEDLRAGKDVVFDATNISYKRRRQFLSELSGLKIPNLLKVCVFCATPYDTCIRNNQQRERHVPEDVLLRMYQNFDIPMYLEGWDTIRVENDSDKDRHELFHKMVEMDHDNPHHNLTVGQHSFAAWSNLLDKDPDVSRALSQATLLHDIGKISPSIKVFEDSKGNPSETAHYYGHERTGAYDSFSYTRQFPIEERLHIALLIRWHMLPYSIDRSPNPEKTAGKYIRLLGKKTFEEILTLNQSDRIAH